jgi:ribosomal protein L16/L10AE
MTTKRTSDPAQVRQSENNRSGKGEFRLTVSVWVDAKHKDAARIAAKKAVKKAVAPYLKR